MDPTHPHDALTLSLHRRSPVERAGYMLACLARGTTSVNDYDAAMGALTVEAILEAAEAQRS